MNQYESNLPYCYMTFADEKFITCVIRQAQRLKHLKTQYPYIVLVDEKDENTQKKLIINQIEFRTISAETFIYTNNNNARFLKTFNKFKIIDFLDEYKAICWVDADIIFIENCDKFFYDVDYITFKSVNNILEENIDGCMFIITNQINKKEFIDFVYKHQENYTEDEHILNAFFRNRKNTNCFGADELNYIHFSGEVKWFNLHAQFKLIQTLFYNLNSQDFNCFIDNYASSLRELNDLWMKHLIVADKTLAQVDALFEKEWKNSVELFK